VYAAYSGSSHSGSGDPTSAIVVKVELETGVTSKLSMAGLNGARLNDLVFVTDHVPGDAASDQRRAIRRSPTSYN
jgi:hypothetical protein